MSRERPALVLTSGEPAGIGPDLCVQIAQHDLPCRLAVIADTGLLRERARLLGLPLEIHPFPPIFAHRPGSLSVLHVPLARPAIPGSLDPANAGYVLDTLARAVDLCTGGTCDAMVTAPVHKGVINESGIAFTGHTEHLAALTGGEAVMMLAGGGMRVALATTHLPLKEVPGAITRAGLMRKLRILHRDLVARFALDAPRIAVTGLNPHAGESGHLGREEIDVIIPALETLRREGLDLSGPLPADTVFHPASLARYDCVCVMYHDQGLPVLKHASFGTGVNVTLGLPVIRTSVDHGTALELAATGRADPGSLLAAVGMAAELARPRKRRETAGDPAG